MPKVDASRYLNSHGTYPKGRGQWIFTVEHEDNNDNVVASMTIRSLPNQGYAEAKKYAWCKAREFGWRRFRVFVEP